MIDITQNEQDRGMLPIPKHDQDKSVEPVLEGTGDEVVEVLSVVRVSLATNALDQRYAALGSTRCPGAQPETEHIQTNLETSEKVVKPILRQSSKVRV